MKWRTTAAGLVGYSLGLLPTAQLVSRAVSRGAVDVTTHGSGNPGAANVATLVGRRAGVIVFLGDAGKGVVAGLLGRRLGGPLGVHVGSTAALIGHCYPVTRPGRGGKGVATSIGQVLVSFPAYIPIDVAVASAVYYAGPLRRNTRLATMVASITWVTCGTFWWRRTWPNLWGPRPSAALAVAAATSAGVIAVRFEQMSGVGDVQSADETAGVA